jgi:paraquat-inducible protein B
LRLDGDEQTLRIPVIIEMDLDKFTGKGASGAALKDPEVGKQLISEGLRAQLQMESFVTGLLFVGIDFFPGSKLTLVQQPGKSHQYQEIPTQPTPLQVAGNKANEVLTKLNEIDLKGLMDSLERTTKGIETLVTSVELKDAVRSTVVVAHRLDTAATNIAQLATTFDDNIKILAADFQLTLKMPALMNQPSGRQAGGGDIKGNRSDNGQRKIVDRPRLADLL